MTTSGHHEQWLNPQKDNKYTCSICLCTAQNAVSHMCGNTFCHYCYFQFTLNKTCPICQQPSNSTPDYRLRREIDKLELYCPLKCGMKVSLNYKSQHLEKYCIHRLVKCEKCSEKVSLSQMSSHILKFCIYRKVNCDKCKVLIPYQELEKHTKSQCKKRIVHCSWCQLKITVDELKTHMTSPEFVGLHLSKMSERMLLMEEKGENDQREIKQLKEKLDKFEYNPKLANISLKNYV